VILETVVPPVGPGEVEGWRDITDLKLGHATRDPTVSSSMKGQEPILTGLQAQLSATVGLLRTAATFGGGKVRIPLTSGEDRVTVDVDRIRVALGWARELESSTSRAQAEAVARASEAV
jgi:hypothetical protein